MYLCDIQVYLAQGCIRGHIHKASLSPRRSRLYGFDSCLTQCQPRFGSVRQMSWFFPDHMKITFLAMDTDILTFETVGAKIFSCTIAINQPLRVGMEEIWFCLLKMRF